MTQLVSARQIINNNTKIRFFLVRLRTIFNLFGQFSVEFHVMNVATLFVLKKNRAKFQIAFMVFYLTFVYIWNRAEKGGKFQNQKLIFVSAFCLQFKPQKRAKFQIFYLRIFAAKTKMHVSDQKGRQISNLWYFERHTMK